MSGCQRDDRRSSRPGDTDDRNLPPIREVFRGTQAPRVSCAQRHPRLPVVICTDELGRPAQPGAYSFRDVQNALPSASQRPPWQGYAGYAGRVCNTASPSPSETHKTKIKFIPTTRLNREPQRFPPFSNTPLESHHTAWTHVDTWLRRLRYHRFPTISIVINIIIIMRERERKGMPTRAMTLDMRMGFSAPRGLPGPSPMPPRLQIGRKVSFGRPLRLRARIQKT